MIASQRPQGRCSPGTARPSAASTCCFVGAPVARVTSCAVLAEHERRGGAQDPESAYDVEVVLRVDLEVCDARCARRDVVEDPAGGPARRAERRGELQQGRVLAELAGPGRALEQGLAAAGSSDAARPPVGRRLGAARAPGGCPGTGRRSARGTARTRARRRRRREGRRHRCSRGLNDRGTKHFPRRLVPTQPPANGGRNSTVEPG